MNYLCITGFQKKLSRIVLGGRFGEQDDKLSFDLLDAYVAFGGNVIETAHSYANGESERLLGQWFRKKANRDRIILIDKGCHPTIEQPRRVSPKYIRMDIHESLDRLNSSYIDIYLLHRDDESIPVGDLLETLNEEMLKGHILSFGASNWHHNRLAEAEHYARAHHITSFCASSCHLSLAIPKEPICPGCLSLDDEARIWYKKTQFPLLAWSSQARGWFSGVYLRGERHDDVVERVFYSEENIYRLKRIQLLSERKKVSPVQCALAYVLNQPFPTFALIGPQSLNELSESAASPELALSGEEIEFLESGQPDAQVLRAFPNIAE